MSDPRHFRRISCCLVFLGIFLLIAGSIARFVIGNDSPPSKEFDNKFFNDAESDFAKGPRFVGGILLIIGSTITGVSIIGFIVSCCFYAKYERERHLVTRAQPMPNPIPPLPNMAGAYPHAPTPIPIPVSNVDYPSNMCYQYPGPVVSNGGVTYMHLGHHGHLGHLGHHGHHGHIGHLGHFGHHGHIGHHVGF